MYIYSYLYFYLQHISFYNYYVKGQSLEKTSTLSRVIKIFLHITLVLVCSTSSEEDLLQVNKIFRTSSKYETSKMCNALNLNENLTRFTVFSPHQFSNPQMTKVQKRNAWRLTNGITQSIKRTALLVSSRISDMENSFKK